MNWVQLLEEPRPVIPPPGMIYSTKPLQARAVDGHLYVIKGPDISVVFAEAACYQLARVVGLQVPPCALCAVPDVDGVFFASKAVRLRSAVEELMRAGKALNPELLAQAVVFDVWVANEDRNVGNIVAEPSATNGTGTVKLYAIDFEKAAVLAGVDRFTVGAMPPEKLWPKGALGTLCERAAVPDGFCARIAAVPRADIEALLQQTIWDLNLANVPWADTAADVLIQRGSRIRELVKEVWHD